MMKVNYEKNSLICFSFKYVYYVLTFFYLLVVCLTFFVCLFHFCYAINCQVRVRLVNLTLRCLITKNITFYSGISLYLML